MAGSERNTFFKLICYLKKKKLFLKNFGQCALRICALVFAGLSTLLSVVAWSSLTSGEFRLSFFLLFHMEIWNLSGCNQAVGEEVGVLQSAGFSKKWINTIGEVLSVLVFT